jgi:hypothetical protein
MKSNTFQETECPVNIDSDENLNSFQYLVAPPESGTSFESKSSPALFSKITEMSGQLAEMMEIHRKQQLMAKKKKLCISTASTGDGEGRRQESSFSFAV